jgi:hypothetical protein
MIAELTIIHGGLLILREEIFEGHEIVFRPDRGIDEGKDSWRVE